MPSKGHAPRADSPLYPIIAGLFALALIKAILESLFH
jgi:hypothetical protein